MKTKLLPSTLFVFIMYLLVFEVSSLNAQFNLNLDYKFRNITTKDGLLSNSVQVCLLDSYGFIWIGTACGLGRYDGISVKNYEHKNSDSTSISDGFIWCIFEDEEHYLWIGTNDGGLNKYDPKTDKFICYKNNPADKNSILSNTVFFIVQDDDKSLWLSTSSGINKFDKKTGEFKRYIKTENDSVSFARLGRPKLFKDRNGNLFAGSGKGLTKYNKAKDVFQRIPLTENDNFEIQCISQDESGIFWIGTQQRGIFKYDENKGVLENILPIPGEVNSPNSNTIRAIVHTKNGLIWMGHLTEKAGVDVYDTKTNTYYHFRNEKYNEFSVGWDVIWDIYKDKYENIWVCTNGGGLSFYSNYQFKFNHLKNLWGENYNRDLKVVWSIIYTMDRFWCYTEGTILSFTKYGEFIKEYSLASTKLRLFSPFHLGKVSGRLYCGDMESAMAYYDIATDQFYKCPIKFKNPEIHFGLVGAILEDNTGNIWLGTGKGLLKLDKDYNEVEIFDKPDSLKSAICKSWTCGLYLDTKNCLWFGADYLTKINLNTQELTFYSADDKNPNLPSGSKFACSFYDNGKDNIWIGYKGSGFDKHDLTNNTFKHYNISNGLINNYILSIYPDYAGNLWFSSVKGIIKFNPATESYTNYNKSDGVQEDEFSDESYCKAEDGMLAYGGINGINWFYPDKIKTNPHIPPVEITSFKVFGNELKLSQNITQTEEIKLTYKENFFTINFASLDYVNPSKNQYKYKLEGIDDEWVLSGNVNEAKYTDITPGDYVFRVIGSNNDGIWNEEGKTMRIIITPPWWQRWWFRGCVAVLIVGFIGYGVNRRFTAIKKEKDIQQDFMRKLIDSQEQERKRISSELHDSLGQDLVIIKNSANMALNSFENKEQAEKFIKQISEISSTALQDVRTISHNLRPAELDKLGLTETIKSLIELVSSSSDIKFEYDVDIIDNLFDKNNEVNYCRIIQECLNNILKHSKATNASVKIKSGSGVVITTIKDNGTGFDYDGMMNKPGMQSFGLTGIYERVKMLKGTLKISTRPGAGTEIIIINQL